MYELDDMIEIGPIITTEELELKLLNSIERIDSIEKSLKLILKICP